MKTILDKNGNEIKVGDTVKVYQKFFLTFPESLVELYTKYPDQIPDIYTIDLSQKDAKGEYAFISKETGEPAFYDNDFEQTVLSIEMPYDVTKYGISSGDTELIFGFCGGAIGLFRFKQEQLERIS